MVKCKKAARRADGERDEGGARAIIYNHTADRALSVKKSRNMCAAVLLCMMRKAYYYRRTYPSHRKLADEWLAENCEPERAEWLKCNVLQIVSITQGEIAEMLGVEHTTYIRQAMRALMDSGAVVRLFQGKHGRASVYLVAPPDGKEAEALQDAETGQGPDWGALED